MWCDRGVRRKRLPTERLGSLRPDPGSPPAGEVDGDHLGRPRRCRSCVARVPGDGETHLCGNRAHQRLQVGPVYCLLDDELDEIRQTAPGSRWSPPNCVSVVTGWAVDVDIDGRGLRGDFW